MGGIQGFLICLIIKNHPSLGKSKVSNWVEKEKLSKCGNVSSWVGKKNNPSVGKFGVSSWIEKEKPSKCGKMKYF